MKIIKFSAEIIKGLVAITVWLSLTQSSIADEVPTPRIDIVVTNSTQLSITITNGVSFANYELYRRSLLDPNWGWHLHTIGSAGQTNFITDMGIENTGFFQVTVGNDWDGDSAPNYSDADPNNAAIGILSITIDSPTNGSSFN